MLSHTVLFRLRRPLGEGDKEKFVAALQEFAADAPLAAGPARVDTDLGLRDPENLRVADATLSTTFADADTFARYLDHPRHRALVAEVLEPLCESWLSVQADVEG
ncbi:Dabb family protein [Pseudonocardia kujensis]|uniref:Dabb family protein n=1 Tax=Pseudonocardia kujensis TaxID=1128675 RepID=UPI001E3D052E|nr:Dabb family protein [Pseudonocardia kujensis]MCE0765786.1 Dabb family protein [Pseudonocardia kujensis]